MLKPEYEVKMVWKWRQLSQFCLILKKENKTCEEETFNLISTSIAPTAGLCKLTLVLQDGPETRTVSFCLCVSLCNSIQSRLRNLQKERHRWPRISYVSKKHQTTTTTSTSTSTTITAPTKIFKTCCKMHVARWYRIGWRLLRRHWRRWIRHRHLHDMVCC